MNVNILLMSTIILVALVTSVVFVLQVQRLRSRKFSAHLVDWENAQKRSLQIWEIQQEKRAVELENSLTTNMQDVDIAWKEWEAKDASFIASTARQSNALLLHRELEQEIVRLPFIDDVPLKDVD